jgi:Tol biopolymer transport system component
MDAWSSLDNARIHCSDRRIEMRKRLLVTLTFVTFAAILLAARSAVSAQVRDRADAALKAVMDKEMVEGDLKGAIEQYKKIAESKDRALAAKALIRMADCYQKLGNTESRKIYEQVVKDYADQKEAATMARARLAGNGTSTLLSSKVVWSGPDVDDEGTISRDGRFLSVTNWHTGNLTIHEFATGTDRRITDGGRWCMRCDDEQFAEQSAISRDGKQAAYSWFVTRNKRYELRLTSLTGNAVPRRLYDNPDITWLTPFDWSPDGKSIAVQLQRKDSTKQIGLVSTTDGSFRLLKSIDWRGARRMSFSPDGQWLGYDLFETGGGPERRVLVLSVDGSSEITLEHRGYDQMVGWSPDGRWLLFSSDRSGATDLWGVPFAGGRFQGPAQVLKAGFERSTPLGVSSSGALYYSQAKGGGGPSRIQIASVDLEAGKLTLPATDLGPSLRDSDTRPMWSRDGKRLAYLSARGPLSAKDYVLVIRSNETSEFREFHPNLNIGKGQPPNLFGWVPDGHALLLDGSNAQGRYGIYLVDADSGDLKLLNITGEAAYGSVNWSPDGHSFLVEMRSPNSGDPTPSVYRVDMKTGAVSEIVSSSSGKGFAFYPQWSADGKNIYYRRGVGDCVIIERDLSSGAEKELAHQSVCTPPIPTPDGRYIVTANTDPNTNSRLLVLIPTGGGQTRELMRVPSGVKPDLLNNTNQGSWVFPFELQRGWLPNHNESFLAWKGSASAVNPNGAELWRVSVDGGQPTKVGVLPDGLTTFSVVLNPDGRHLAYAVTDQAGGKTVEIWALENFLPKPAAAH